MAVEQLEHFTIRCRDLEPTRSFYSDVLGLRVGPRPNLGFPGYWLYCGDIPVVHLVTETGAVGTVSSSAETGALDHIAFRGLDFAATVDMLRSRDIQFRMNEVKDFGLSQIFVRDPNGILIELNFRTRPATAS